MSATTVIAADTHIICMSPHMNDHHTTIEEKTADFYKRIHAMPAAPAVDDINDGAYRLARVERSPTPEERDQFYKYTMGLITEEKAMCALMCDKLSQMFDEYPDAESMRECIRRTRDKNIDGLYQNMVTHKWYTYPTEFSGECLIC